MQPGDHFPSVVHVVVSVQPQPEPETALDEALAAAGALCDRRQLLDVVLDLSDEEAHQRRFECGHHLLCLLASEHAFSTGVKSNGLEHACQRWITDHNLCRAERTLAISPRHGDSWAQNPQGAEIMLAFIYELMLRDGIDVVRAFVTSTVFTGCDDAFVAPPEDFDTYKSYSPTHHPGSAKKLREALGGKHPRFATQCTDYAGRVYVWCFIDEVCRGKGRGRDGKEAYDAAANQALKWVESTQKQPKSFWNSIL